MIHNALDLTDALIRRWSAAARPAMLLAAEPADLAVCGGSWSPSGDTVWSPSGDGGNNKMTRYPSRIAPATLRGESALGSLSMLAVHQSRRDTLKGLAVATLGLTLATDALATAPPAISIFDFIPESEWAAIKSGRSTFDCATALQAALTAAASSGPSIVELHGYRYKINSGLIFDANRVSIEGGGAILDCVDFKSGNLFSVKNSDIDANERAIKNSVHYVRGVELRGPGVEQTAVRAVFVNDSRLPTLSNLSFDNVSFIDFSVDAYLADGAFLVTFKKCVFAQRRPGMPKTYSIEIPAASNSGERNLFIDCQWFTRNLCMRQSNGNASTKIVGCSFDYIDRMITLEAGQIHAVASHLETGGHGAPPAHDYDMDYPVHVSGANSLFRFADGNVSLTGPRLKYAPFYADSTCIAGGVELDGVHFGQPNAWTTPVIAGSGRTRSHRLLFYQIAVKPPISDFENSLSNGGFENASIGVSEWRLSDPSRITRAAGIGRQGSACMRIQAMSGESQSARIRLSARPGAVLCGELWYKIAGVAASQGTAQITACFLDRAGNRLSWVDLLPSGTAAWNRDWARLHLNLQVTAPPGTAECEVLISLAAATSGATTMLVDDVNVAIS